MAEYMERLSRFVSDTRLQDLDPADIAAAKAVVLDTIGAILAGSLLPENRNLAQMASKTGGSGPSTILGRQAEVQAVFATLVNATAGVALEMDEGNRMGGGHPSIHVLPAALAVAEEVGARGSEVPGSPDSGLRGDLAHRVRRQSPPGSTLPRDLGHRRGRSGHGQAAGLRTGHDLRGDEHSLFDEPRQHLDPLPGRSDGA